MGRWRYFAERLDGSTGGSQLIHSDLPLSDVEITQTLSGPGGLSCTIEPEVASLRGDDGRPIFREWSTAIWAEKDDEIRGGGILARPGIDNARLSLECVGFSGYLNGLPYTADRFFVEADPLDLARHIWQHAQSQRGGNLGVTVDATTSPVRIGTELRQVEFDTQAGPVSFEAGPYKLNWWQNHNLQGDFDKLAADTPFEYVERLQVDSAGAVKKHLRLGYPTIGSRRADLRFYIGENIHVVPSVEYAGDEFANGVLVLGAGEGRTMIRGAHDVEDGRLRRPAVVQDKQVRSARAANDMAKRELAMRRGEFTVTDLQVQDHSHAPLGAWSVGDEILLQGDLDWVDNTGGVWVRVVGLTIKPSDPHMIGMAVVRTDKVGG